MVLKTATPYELPYPVAADTPDVPRDILALANRVHSQLGGLSDRIDAVVTTASANTKAIATLNTWFKAPTEAKTPIAASSGFTAPYSRLWKYGHLVAFEFQFTTTVKRSDTDGNTTEIKMGTWKSGFPKPYGNFPMISMIDGLMATGYVNASDIRLSTLEAGAIWAAKAFLRFGGFYFTQTART